MGRWRVAGDGISSGEMARDTLGSFARGLRPRQLARRAGVLDRFPALGLARDVLHWRPARSAHSFHSLARERKRTVARQCGREKRLARILPRGGGELKAFPVP